MLISHALFVTLAASLVCATAEPQARSQEAQDRSAGAVPVVVELFTSEGCSSCPPADTLASEIAQSASADSRPIVLAFHVDYWDKLGWKDCFASPEASARQRRYVASLTDAKTDAPPPVGVYTPQMVVNGSRALVGSDKSLASSEIKLASAEKRGVHALSVRCSRGEQDTLTLAIIFERSADDSTALEALGCIVENELTSKVARGENSGRTLHHDRVVRAFASKPLTTPDSAISLSIPADLKPANSRVVVVVQHAATGDRRVIAATEVAFPESPTGK